MIEEVELRLTIDELKKILADKAIQHHFNFQHPEILHLSQELDFLIVKSMKHKKNRYLCIE
ncbi:aspartyl-phosphate phosphatase Spo0E family protein [Aneurinibacillus tyrosinisolvens]|uniref:aspartyl-phosphate phosphatase Spo0E family protein n=1 Tax=Aneurinibacillus tyrosinisolvens TaxID=1443435 RepID=UPI00063F2198|nr:aspartyl-phosphate phosphatase Spo0E family protein [Aneurinibacillus tyrosinisolvens]